MKNYYKDSINKYKTEEDYKGSIVYLVRNLIYFEYKIIKFNLNVILYGCVRIFITGGRQIYCYKHDLHECTDYEKYRKWYKILYRV